MKNQRWILVLITIIFLAVFLTGCGNRDTPNSLAREMMELTRQMSANPENAEQIQARMDDVTARVENLSMVRQLAYVAELTRLGTAEIRDVLNTEEVQDSLNVLDSALEELRNLRF